MRRKSFPAASAKAGATPFANAAAASKASAATAALAAAPLHASVPAFSFPLHGRRPGWGCDRPQAAPPPAHSAQCGARQRPRFQSPLRAALVLAASFLAASSPDALADAETGRAKAEICVACHGPAGNSTQPAYPSLAGQPKQFIVSALYQFREGKRVNALMSPMAASLSNADLNDLAAYFSAQKMAPPAKPASPATIAAGEKIAQANNCTACHSPQLTGQQHIPRLAGQHRDYLAAQLAAFRAATRGEMDGMMTSVAQVLTPQDIDALADYLSGLDRP